MRKNSKKIIAALMALSFILLPVLSGCQSGTPEESGTAEVTTEQEKGNVLDLSSVDFFIVRQDDSSEAITKEMLQMSADLKTMTEAKVNVSVDWYKNESEIDRNEILLGNVNRPEVAEVFPTLKANDYIIRFNEKKLWIVGGNDASTLKAAELFRNMLKDTGSLRFVAEDGIIAQFNDTYSVNETQLLGKDIRDYKVLYTSSKYAQVGAVQSFLSDVQVKSGYVLKSATNVNMKTDCKIMLKSTYEDGSAVSLYDYEVKNEGTVITVYGGSNKAFRQGLKLVFEAFAKGDLAAADATVSFKGAYDYLTDDFYDVLKGVKFYALGDSYFAGSGIDKSEVWFALMAKKYKLSFENYGIGGSTISNFTTDRNPMVDRITSMALGKPDIILFEGGRNDFSQVTPLGGADSRDSKTFQGAVRLCLERLHKRYPNALIICCTNWNFGGTHGIADCYGYAKAFKEVADQYDYSVCINATNLNRIPVDVRDENFRHNYCIGDNDISHLNPEGMKYVEPYFEEWIAFYYAAFKNGTLNEVRYQ